MGWVCGPMSQACSLVPVICCCVANNPELEAWKNIFVLWVHWAAVTWGVPCSCSHMLAGSGINWRLLLSRIWRLGLDGVKAGDWPGISPPHVAAWASSQQGSLRTVRLFQGGCLPSQQECQGTGSGSCQPLKTETLKLTQCHFHNWISNQSRPDMRGGDITLRSWGTSAKEFVATFDSPHAPTRTQRACSYSSLAVILVWPHNELLCIRVVLYASTRKFMYTVSVFPPISLWYSRLDKKVTEVQRFKAWDHTTP